LIGTWNIKKLLQFPRYLKKEEEEGMEVDSS